MHDAVRVLARCRGYPARLREVLAEAPAEVVAAALCDEIDHSARKPAEFSGDAAREDVRFGNGVLDEQVVRAAEEVVVDVDAVEHEHVVEGRRAGNRNLT